jgi:LmbE family N-acetylglucosaminyl deacetylase
MAEPSEQLLDSYPQLDVIAVGAHPDDVEIACGGTLAKLARQGYQVGIVDLTDGEPTPGSSGPEERLAEAQEAAEKLGVARRVTLDLPNRRLFDSFESRVALAKEFRKYRPRIVLGFGGKTPLASPDHWQAVQITDAAVPRNSIFASRSNRPRWTAFTVISRSILARRLKRKSVPSAATARSFHRLRNTSLSGFAVPQL